VGRFPVETGDARRPGSDRLPRRRSLGRASRPDGGESDRPARRPAMSGVPPPTPGPRGSHWALPSLPVEARHRPPTRGGAEWCSPVSVTGHGSPRRMTLY
jgi:hypothetical protein